MRAPAFVGWLAVALSVGACDPGASAAAPAWSPPQVRSAPGALADSTFAGLIARISEDGGYFDTDNLISNENGYLKVIGALAAVGEGGAYVGVGPDQNYSYIAALRPDIAFIVDVRRDNLLHHLLLKALIEASPTRVEFLSRLHGRSPPSDPQSWRDRPVADVVAFVDAGSVDEDVFADVSLEVARATHGYGLPLRDADLATMVRFHRTFVDAGLSLRFTSYGRPPRAYYPTYRQLVVETDLDGHPASYLASAEAYDVVRDLHLANRIVPVVGDLAGGHALREMGAVMREWGVSLTAFYASNVEYYLWRGGAFEAWRNNLSSLPATDDAVVIRSYFPNFGTPHPSAVRGYYAAQLLQPVAEVVAGGFGSYWDVVTRGVLPLR